jgi:CubicO group peptidase (beta-lactamase class C family)
MKPFPPLVNELLEVMGPAGSINSNLEDLANWLIFLLNRGSFNHSQIVSASNLAEAWKPSMKMDQYYSVSPPYFPVLSTMAAYGM